MTIDERLEALALSVELLAQDVHGLQDTAKVLLDTAKQDGENIRALVRIAEIRERRIFQQDLKP